MLGLSITRLFIELGKGGNDTMKRVKQVSIDILVDDNIDGENLADNVADVLKGKRFVVVGYSFQNDMTETYMEYYPDLIKKME